MKPREPHANTNTRPRRRLAHAILAAMLLSAMVLVPPGAALDEERALGERVPNVFPSEWRWGDTTGYDWSARPHATHVTVDAGEPVTTIDLTHVTTQYLDIETSGLKPYGEYRLVHEPSGKTRTDLTASSGTTVFWNTPTYLGTWQIVEAATGSTVAEVVLRDDRPVLPGLMQPAHSCTNSWGTCDYHYHYNSYGKAGDYSDYGPRAPPRTDPENDPRDPTSSLLEDGFTTEQAAMSFTSDVVIKTLTCWDHDMNVDAYVSGGFAGMSGTAGGSKAYSRELCFYFESQGAPMCLRLTNDFRKDTYRDGSSKVYMQDTRPFLHSDYNWCSIWVEKYGHTHTTHSTFTSGVTVTERNAGGVYFAGAAGSTAFGVGMGTTLKANLGQASEVRIEFHPPDSNEHRYTYRFVAGDSTQTGIIGAAWKDY